MRKILIILRVVSEGRRADTFVAGRGVPIPDYVRPITFIILAKAVEEKRSYDIPCPALLICGTKDHAGSCIRYNKAWHKKTGIPIKWIEGAGHNSNTDRPEEINKIIERFIASLEQ